MSSVTISSSDEEILKALTIADNLMKELIPSSSNIKINLPFESDTFLEGSEFLPEGPSVSDLTSDNSVFVKNSSKDLNEMYSSFTFDPEFHAVLQDIQELYLMNDLFIERKNSVEIANKSCIKDAMSSAEEILSETILNKRLENVNLVVNHILTIADQIGQIKQVLQDEPGKNTLKVAPSCQKDVIQFFHIADTILRKVQEDADYIENCEKENITKVNPIDVKELHSRVQSIIMSLARRLDILTEFRSNLSTAEDLESGIESAFLEADKSNNLKSLSEQVSSIDSGMNLLIKFE